MFTTYIVKQNEDINDIANKFDVSVEEILNVNDLTSATLRPGLQLRIPMQQNNKFIYYKVKKGDDLYKISQENLVDVEMLAEINGLKPYDYLYEGQTILVPRRGIKLYITKEGDTLESIALNNNIPMESLISNNPTIYLLPEQLLIYF